MADLELMPEYSDYVQRNAEREKVLFERIRNLDDPIDAISSIVDNEGKSLSGIWESDAGYPIDGLLFCIIMIPIALGLIGTYLGKIWEPKLVGDELYDEYGNRIIEYPKMPIAYLQQSRKEGSAARENRNTLAWLCHKWIISTNDVIQELHAPFPLEETKVKSTTAMWNPVTRLDNIFTRAAKEWRRKQRIKQHLMTPSSDELEAEGSKLWKHRMKMAGHPASRVDMRYIKGRLGKARRLWLKIHEWIQENEERLPSQKEHLSDTQDSYWSSSETFSSDSGEHWSGYKSIIHRWVQTKKKDADYKLDRIRIRKEEIAAAVAARKRDQEEKAKIEKEKEQRQVEEVAKINEKFGKKQTPGGYQLTIGGRSVKALLAPPKSKINKY